MTGALVRVPRRAMAAPLTASSARTGHRQPQSMPVHRLQKLCVYDGRPTSWNLLVQRVARSGKGFAQRQITGRPLHVLAAQVDDKRCYSPTKNAQRAHSQRGARLISRRDAESAEGSATPGSAAWRAAFPGIAGISASRICSPTEAAISRDALILGSPLAIILALLGQGDPVAGSWPRDVQRPIETSP